MCSFLLCLRYLLKEPVLNDDLPSRLLYGLVKVKTKVKELTETAAVFEDGTVEEDIDVIVFATGYTFSFPFLEDSLVKVEGNSVSLYKYMFPPQLEKPTLACIGLIQPLGSIFPTVELQARWATRVFKGEWAAQPSGVLTFFSLNFTGREAALWWRSKDSYSLGSWFSAATLWEPEIELRLWDLHTSMALPTEPYVSHRDKVLLFFF